MGWWELFAGLDADFKPSGISMRIKPGPPPIVLPPKPLPPPKPRVTTTCRSTAMGDTVTTDCRWTAGFKIVDANGQALAYVYGHADPRDAQIANELSLDEARLFSASPNLNQADTSRRAVS
jgi:hypothetical protein